MPDLTIGLTGLGSAVTSGTLNEPEPIDPLVQCGEHLIPFSYLERVEHEEVHPNALVRKTVWLYKGTEVRSDLHVMMLRGLASDLTKGNLDGQ